MRWDLLATSVASGIAGALVQHTFATYVWPNRHLTYSWLFSVRNHGKYGAPCESDLVLSRQGYSLGYSFDKRSALWASYVLSRNSIGVDVDRGDNFRMDLDIPERYRVKPEDFTNSGYDKGHLVPSASVDFSRKSNDETFLMSNVTLQDPLLNRQAWGKLEGLIRKWTFSHGKLAVVTGPLYSKRNKRVKGIAVPKRFYKIVYSFRHKACIAFLLPNEPVENEDLWEHATSGSVAETETGYSFFSVLGERGRLAKTTLDLELWQR